MVIFTPITIPETIVETCHGASLQTTQIDLSHYATGVYLIQLVNNGNVMAVRKAVKE